MTRTVASLLGGVTTPTTLVACVPSNPSAASTTDSGAEGATELADQCRLASSLEDAGSGVEPCNVGLAYLVCTGPTATCGCITNDLMGCVANCGEESGATCQNQCA